MGLSNRLTARRCSVICTAFPQTADKYDNAFHTGAIIRPELYSGDRTKIVGFTSGRPNLLIMGGSQGSSAINSAVWRSIDALLAGFNVLHITGRGKTNQNIQKNNYIQTEYLSAPENAFDWADIVISRAGSGALCEILSLRKPAVFIPLPKSESRGDQVANAKYMSELGCCAVLPQKNLSAENLLNILNKTLRNKQQIIANCDKLDWLDGTKRVAKIITDFLL
jgi:UDP-N-acetylglucosamine--N-acetylmuramyl-(pentapeptide) pyrophosphoryl-undecaprenol N-acetylglucosamine transferase